MKHNGELSILLLQDLEGKIELLGFICRVLKVIFFQNILRPKEWLTRTSIEYIHRERQIISTIGTVTILSPFAFAINYKTSNF